MYNINLKLASQFAVDNNIVLSIREFKSIDPRISVLTINPQYFDIIFVNNYNNAYMILCNNGPTEKKNIRMMNYDNLEHTLKKILHSGIRGL